MLPLHLISKKNLVTVQNDTEIGKNTPIINQQHLSMFNTVRISKEFFNQS